MIMAAHQPQYLPYLGYFHKIAACDVFIWLDDVQHKKREFQNRNRIRTPKGWIWLTVPVLTKGKYHQTIREVEINNSTDWARTHWESIRCNYAKAPHFREHAPFLAELYGRRWDKLDALSLELVRYFCTCFNIRVPFRNASEFELRTKSSQRLVDLTQAVSADTYLSGSGGRDYLEEELFRKNKLTLAYQRFVHPAYPQVFPGFEQNLSALDFLCNVDPEKAVAFFAGSDCK